MRVAEFGTAASVDAVLTKSEYSAPILSTPMAHRSKPLQTVATKGYVRTYLSAFPDKGGAPDQNGPPIEAANQVQQVRNKVKRA